MLSLKLPIRSAQMDVESSTRDSFNNRIIFAVVCFHISNLPLLTAVNTTAGATLKSHLFPPPPPNARWYLSTHARACTRTHVRARLIKSQTLIKLGKNLTKIHPRRRRRWWNVQVHQFCRDPSENFFLFHSFFSRQHLSSLTSSPPPWLPHQSRPPTCKRTPAVVVVLTTATAAAAAGCLVITGRRPPRVYERVNILDRLIETRQWFR